MNIRAFVHVLTFYFKQPMLPQNDQTILHDIVFNLDPPSQTLLVQLGI